MRKSQNTIFTYFPSHTKHTPYINIMYNKCNAFAPLTTRIAHSSYVCKVNKQTCRLNTDWFQSAWLLWFWTWPSREKRSPSSLLLIRHNTTRTAFARLTYLHEIKAGQQGNAVFGHLAFESFLRRHGQRYAPLKTRCAKKWTLKPSWCNFFPCAVIALLQAVAFSIPKCAFTADSGARKDAVSNLATSWLKPWQHNHHPPRTRQRRC